MIDGASIAVLADLGPNRAPFVLNRDHLNDPASLLTPATNALTDLTLAIVSVDAKWGATDWSGPVPVVEAGELTAVVFDPSRVLDPGNPQSTDPPAPGRSVRILIDGQSVFAGRTTAVSHRLSEQLTEIAAADAIAEASGIGIQTNVAAGPTSSQLVTLRQAAGWPAWRLRIEGEFATERYADAFDSTFLEGLQRLMGAELGALYADGVGAIVCRARGVPPNKGKPLITVGNAPYTGTAEIGTGITNRVINEVVIHPIAEGTPDLVFRDPTSIAAFGESVLEADAADLLLSA